MLQSRLQRIMERMRIQEVGIFNITCIFLCIFASQACFAQIEAPTNVSWESRSSTAINFFWENTAGNDVETEIQLRDIENGDWFSPGSTNPGVGDLRFTGFEPGKRWGFRVRSLRKNAEGTTEETSDFSGSLEVQTRDDLVIDGEKCVLTSPGEFDYPLSVEGFQAGDLEIAGVPDSVSLQEGPLRLSGTLPSGTYLTSIACREGNHTRNLSLLIILTEAPVVRSPVGELVATTDSESVFFEMNEIFEDLDVESTVRFETVRGNIDVALSDTAAPITVANFLNYADRGAWDGSFFHSSQSAFVIQGGAFKPGTNENIDRVKADAPIQNEFDPSRSNVCGTLTMAKFGGPNSATSEWFFNANNNSEDFDSRNGGHTQFGRVMGNGMEVVRVINALPTRDIPVNIRTCEGEPPNETCSEQPIELQNWPVLQVNQPGLDTEDLVIISKISRVDPMTFSVISNSDPSVASVTIEAALLKIDYLSSGTTNVTLSATDLDGASTNHTFSVRIDEPGSTYDSWATIHSLEGALREPMANPDNDLATNFSEYAFGGDPSRNDDAITAAVPRLGGDNFEQPAVAFRYRGDATDIEYNVEQSTDLKTWTTIWASSSGLDVPSVVSTSDLGMGIQLLTIKASGNDPLPLYLRVRARSL
jgi:cyclophilin family peptidyl-prolyl cis-trans isomerase